MLELVTVPRFLVERLPSQLLEDLGGYFDPDAFIVPRTRDDDISTKLKAATGSPATGAGLVSETEVYTADDHLLAVVPSVGELDRLDGASFDRPLTILTPFLENQYSFGQFDSSIPHIEKYAATVETIDAPYITHLSTATEAETRLPTEAVDAPLHGAKWVQGNDLDNIRYLPYISIDPDSEHVSVELLRDDRLGLQAIHGLGYQNRELLQSIDIYSRSDLASKDPEDLLALDGIGGFRAAAYVTRAMAIEDNQFYQFAQNPLAGENRLYVDIETDSTEPSIIWQIGLYDEEGEKYGALLQQDPDKPGEVIKKFGDWLTGLPDDRVLVAWHGNQFDFPVLEAFLGEHGQQDHIERWNELAKVDLLHDVVHRCGAIPARSWSLDRIAKAAGYERRVSGLDGRDAAETYVRFMNGGPEPDWEMWKTYCKDDVLAMVHLYDTLEQAEQPYEVDDLEAKNPGTTGSVGGMDTSEVAFATVEEDEIQPGAPGETDADAGETDGETEGFDFDP